MRLLLKGEFGLGQKGFDLEVEDRKPSVKAFMRFVLGFLYVDGVGMRDFSFIFTSK